MKGRRASLLSSLAIAGVAAIPACSAAAIGRNDRKLLDLGAQLRTALAAEEAVCKAERETIAAQGQAAFQNAQTAAFDAWDAVVGEMVATAADGLAGVAVKAAQLCSALDVGATSADHDLAESLMADFARLVPEVAL